MNPYEILGVKKSANTKQIEGAFRQRAKELHPDMPGGDAAKFDMLKKAKDVLCNDDLRKTFDQHGWVPGFDGAPDYAMAHKEISHYFSMAMSQLTPEKMERLDVVAVIRDALIANITELKGKIEELVVKKAMLKQYAELLKKRLKTEITTEKNLFFMTIQNIEISMTHEHAQLELSMRGKMLAAELLVDYSFNPSKIFRPGFVNGMMWTTTTTTGC